MKGAWPCVAVLLAGLVIGWLWNGALWGERYAQLERDHAQHIATQQAASADVISRTLLRERDLHNQLEEYEQNAQAEKQEWTRKLADSNAVSRRMREKLDDISGRIGADTGTAADCQAARVTAGMLADMHARLDEATGVYAATADGSRIAGRACEAAYGAARGL
ncbi:MAG: DUF2514 family protein [Gammaproteobacteria bacterium]|nr:DUF2514 family protein [Gammaproteobacteria bacterium]